jgi:topoisomerase-4 subunit A
MAGATILRADQGLTVISGKRLLKIKPADLEHYQGERGRRGQKLPRGFQRVDQLMAGLG